MNSVREDIRNCEYYADKLLRITVVHHITRFLADKVEDDSDEALRFNITTGFTVARNHSFGASTSFNATELAFRLFDAFGLPVRALGISHSVSTDDSLSNGENASGSLFKGLDFNIVPVRIPVTAYQSCLEVKYIRKVGPFGDPLPFYDDTPTAKHNGLYICDDPVVGQREIGELYAHVWSHAGDTSVIDAFNPKSQSVNISIQGERDISAFYNSVRGSIRADHDMGSYPSAAVNDARDYYANTPMSMPGTILRPVNFPRQASPSLVDMALGNYKAAFSAD